MLLLALCVSLGLAAFAAGFAAATWRVRRVALSAVPAAQDPEDCEFLHALFEHLPVSLYVFSVDDQRVMSINAHAEQEFGHARESLIGKTLSDGLGHQVAGLAEPAMREALAQGAMVERDFDLHTQQGKRVVRGRVFALRNSRGEPHRLIALARDVTRERHAERELQESQAGLLELAETVEDSLYVTNPARDHYEFLTTIKYDGLPRRTFSHFDVRPDTLRSYVEPGEADLHQERQALELRLEPTDLIFRFNHPQRGMRWLRARTRSRRLPSGDIRVYGMSADVTLERERQIELQRALEAAERASEAKSQFMASMSHEIRTPMNGILGMSELLLGTPLSEQQRRFVQTVYRSGEALLEIINDILDFSKIEAGRLELAANDFVLRNLVEDILELLAPRAQDKGLELSLQEEPGLPAVVNGDPLRLRQVLTNLVANAIKFTDQGEVVVSLRRAPVGDAQAIEFSVRDTGIGIEADMLPRLFEAFTQGSVGMSRHYGGTGLGLTISRRLVVLMGGDIAVRSQLGVGSEFSFSLPLAAGGADSASLGQEVQAMPPLRVLVVDDNETNRIVLDNMLATWGMAVVLAEDGRQALDILLGKTAIDARFDLALVDMRMPSLDGMGLALALQAAGAQPQLKMILLSSVSAPGNMRAAQQAGFQRYVTKPVRKAELRQAILGLSVAKGEAPAPAPRLDALVLVVEDNVVNQEVIGQMLRSLGCRVQICSGALAGLRALCEKRFDLVLMDIQMPGMDGIEALRWFRGGVSRQEGAGNDGPDSGLPAHDAGHEAGHATGHTTGRFTFLTSADTPIIAVTANALGGDEARFLELGFDDYLSKPFRQSQLLAMLTHHIRFCAPADSPDSGVRSSPGAADAADAAPEAVLDPQALARLRELDPNGENHLMERVVNAFETSLARLMPQLQQALDQNELGGIRHVAHTLKSSSASIGAMKLSRQCADVEARARQEVADGMAERIAQLQAEVEVVRVALKQILGT